MPEQAYTPPETKYEVHIDELMKAIKGEPFEQGNGLWRMKGEEIEGESALKEVGLYLNKEQEYIVLANTKITGADIIALQNHEFKDYNIGLIFYKSIIPKIVLSHAKIAGLQFWNSQSGNIVIDGISQSGNIVIDGISQSDGIVIDGNSQSGYIRIDNNSQSGYIVIDGNSQSGGIVIHGNSQSGYIRIDNNSYSGDINISKNSRSGIISLDDNSQSGKISLDDNSQSGKIFFHNNSQAGYIRLGDNSQSGNISISNNSQLGYIKLGYNSQSGDISISNNSQLADINISNNSQSGNIWISRNKTAMAIVIGTNSQTGNLLFSNALLSQVSISDNHFGLSLYNTAFLLFTITDCLVSTLEWQAGTKGELYINQSQLLHLQMTNTSLLKDSLLSLSDTQLQYGVLQEVLVQGNLLLRKVGSPKAPFAWRDIAAYIGEEPTDEGQKEFWNNKKVVLEKQKQAFYENVLELAKQYGPGPIFRITHSSLGKTEITGCDFSAFQFQYYNSNLLGCFITGTQLPKRNMVIYDPVADTVLNNQSHSNTLFEQKTAVYNQFKKIYENQGDVVEASVFHAQAMHWQQKLLWRQFRHDKEGFWKKVKLFFENIGFRLNWFSNNHGESWLVALVFTIVVGFIFFTASIWGLTHWGDGKTWCDNIHKLPGFMLPTHGYDYLSKEIIETTKATYPNLKVNLWHTTWDFLGRIFIGYGIFQFISAFRRHGKKGG